MFYKLNIFVYLIALRETITLNTCYSNEVHALILARGGSKGIKLKNLIKIGGLSLLARTITTIRQSGLLQNVWVSTDDDKIAAEALKFGALVHYRSNYYALDNTSSLDAVNEFLMRRSTISKFALFQCTSPFLKAHYIAEAFKKFRNSDCVFSVSRVAATFGRILAVKLITPPYAINLRFTNFRTYKLRWKKTISGFEPINFNPSSRPRRQNWSGELEENGMFYFSTRQLIENNLFQNNKCSVVEMDPFHSLDIDAFSDVLLARCFNYIDDLQHHIYNP